MTDKNPLLTNILQTHDTSESDFIEQSLRTIDTDTSTKSAFEAALSSIDVHSVFDIIRRPKSTFCRKLSKLAEQHPAVRRVNAELTYDHAMCYAIQIGRLYREEQISSTAGTRSSNASDSPRFEDLFQEKWGEFCKVGAISAVDSPVAYLTSLYRLITQVVEPQGEGTRAKVKLNDRRPDLKDLQINQQTTFTPLPMLTIVNDILGKNIEAFLGKDAAPLPEQLAQKRHPFMFPYHFAHHQCVLGLGEKKTPLGDINYRISQHLPILRDARNDFGQHAQSSAVAQGLLSGLSAQQQLLVTEPTLFSDFYISRAQLETDGWYSPSSSLSAWENLHVGYVLRTQDNIKKTVPDASALTTGLAGSGNAVTLAFTSTDSPPAEFTFDFISHRPGMGDTDNQVITNAYPSGYPKMLCIRKSANLELPDKPGYSSRFCVLGIANAGFELPVTAQKAFIKYNITLCLDEIGHEDYLLPENEKLFFLRHYGIEVLSNNSNPLVALDTLMAQTGLNAEATEALLATRRFLPKLSPNCISSNPMSTGRPNAVLAFPYSSHYGASYVNGVGACNSEAGWADAAGNFMGLKEIKTEDSTTWRLTNTSLNRFDRLQRMIRLQRWLDIPFAELDTLIVAAMRAEGEANLEMALNENTLRTLGVFRHFSQRYNIKAEEFAAFLHHLSPYADTDRTPLFDEVFNSPMLFDAPLVLDQSPFETEGDTPEDQQTVYQLCAGLGLQPTETSLERLAHNTRTHVGPLSRSLTIVSSLYRQARIARMFGLSVEDSWALADLLGGDAYHKALTSGALRTEGNQPDTLDILMQMDWAMSWLKDSKQDISTVRAHIGLDASTLVPTQELVDRLRRLHQDANQSLISEQQVLNLNLPNDVSKPIDWLAELSKTLINAIGLVKALPLQQIEDLKGQLETALQTLIEPLALEPQDKAQAQTKLCEFLLIAHDRQLRLIEGLLQEQAKLHMDRAAVVTHWAGLSTETLLNSLLDAVKNQRLSVENFDPALLASLQCLLRHAHIARTFNLSELALRLFLASPSWLGAPMSTETPSLAALYLLERYSHLVNEADVSGAALLNYLSLANFSGTPLTDTDALATALAQLLKWGKNELLTLADTLPDGKATTLAHVDWLYRCKQLCQVNGLSASSLLRAVTLNPQSAATEWQAMGDAAMAASR